MNLISSRVIENISISRELFILKLEFPDMIQAGQFVMVIIPDNSKILPRPFSVFDYEEQTQTLSLLIRKRGAGSLQLSKIAQGSKISLFGGLGKGFDTSHKDCSIILMGGGEGIAPMLLTSRYLKAHNNLSIFGGFRYEQEAKILDYFDPKIAIQYKAQDSSNKNRQGLITDLLDFCEEPDYIYTCGPEAMMKAIYYLIKEKQWHTKLYVSMENRMACGVGACMGCVIPGIITDPLKICTEGPVFYGGDVFDEQPKNTLH